MTLDQYTEDDYEFLLVAVENNLEDEGDLDIRYDR
jgi:hypothetical protein